jgi:hypothetical protein
MKKDIKTLTINDLLDLKRKFRSRGGSIPLEKMKSNLFVAYTLYVSTIRKSDRGVLKQLLPQAKANVLVNAVTFLEVFLKQYIKHRELDWNKIGVADLLKNETINLNKAFELITDGKISKIDLILHHYSFSSMESIDKVFSSLTKMSFLKTVESHAPMELKKDDLFRLIEIRNKVIHEGYKIKLSKEAVTLLVMNALAFAISITIHFKRYTNFY